MKETVRWGILGASGIAKGQLIPAMKKDRGSQLKAIASLSGKAKEMAREFRFEKSYDTYEALLEDAEIDAVYIPLPNSLHKEWAIKAAESGKHVLCEKPAALDASEMEEIAESCRKNGVIFMEAFMYRFHPQHGRVKEIIRSGEIGEVKLFRSAFSFFLHEPEGNIRMNRELGGGSLYDIGCYCIHSLRMILEDEPQEVQAFGKWDKKFNVDTTVTVNIKMKNEVLALFDCSFELADRQQYEIVGTKGTIQVPRAYRPDLANGEGLIQVIREDGEERVETISGDQYLAQVQHFTDCVLNGKQPAHSAQSAIHNMKVIDACYRSLTEGRSIRL